MVFLCHRSVRTTGKSNAMKRIFCSVLSVFAAVVLAAQVPVHLELNSVTGIYEKGEKVEVYASLTEEFASSLSMRVTCSGKRVTSSNDLQLSIREKTLIYSGSFDEASAINVSVGNPDDRKSFKTIGLVVSPEGYKPGFSEPADLMTFWKTQIDALRSIEMQVKATEVEHPDQADYVCYDLELSMPEGNPVRGYIAMPRNAADASLPIALLPHAAGVWKPHCQSSVKNVVEWAKKGRGVIAFDINAHGMLNGQPQEYYDNLDKTILKDYAQRPLVSHEEFYFRLMYLRLVRAMDYLTGLKQWDGKRALVYGESQGAGQAGAIAALDPRISMAVMNVPAICDLGGVANGLRGGWPSFYSKNINKPEVKDLSWSILPYYDVALLLKHTKAALVIECGLIDTTCPAECVYAAYNNAVNSVSKTILTYPRRSHRKVENPYYKEWESLVGDVRTNMIDEHLK